MEPSIPKLYGRRALITGSSSGAGLALARGLASAGAEILLNGRDAERLGAAAAELAATGANVRALAFDVTSAESVEEAVAFAESEIGAIDILINAAGQRGMAPMLALSTAGFETVLLASVVSVFTVSRAVARHMIVRESGRIITLCPEPAPGAPPCAAFNAARGAVLHLTHGMAQEWAGHGLCVHAIDRGDGEAAPLSGSDGDAPAFAGSKEALLGGRAMDMVEAALFLSSPAAGAVNGHILRVAGRSAGGR